MTVHRVRLYHSTAGASGYHAWLDVWLTNMQPWNDPEVQNDLPTLVQPPDSETEYYQGELAFEWSHARAIILDQLDQQAAVRCDWHRIGYHECTHDGTGGPCSWDEQREHGSAPAAVPDMSP